jgi:hypothetical protein
VPPLEAALRGAAQIGLPSCRDDRSSPVDSLLFMGVSLPVAHEFAVTLSVAI